MPKPTMPPKPFFRYFAATLWLGIVRQTGIRHPAHQRMLLEPSGDFERVGGMLFLPQRQRFQAEQKLVRVERAERRADVAQQRHADFEDERHVAQAGHVAQRVPINQAVIARIGFGEFRELAVVPLEFAGIHDDAADAGAVAADVFRGRSDDDVRAVIKRPHQADADRVVHDQRNAGLVRDFGDGLEVRHVELGIADGLDVNARGSSA